MVYEYHIKSIRLKRTREGITFAEQYEQLIATYSEKGWRFVQLVDLSNLSLDEQRIDLVFERKK